MFAPQQVAPQKPGTPGVPQAGLLVFPERRPPPLAACLMAPAAVRNVPTCAVFGNTGAEPVDIACGLQYLARHVYRHQSQHPSRARAMPALGPYSDGALPLGISKERVDVLRRYDAALRSLRRQP